MKEGFVWKAPRLEPLVGQCSGTFSTNRPGGQGSGGYVFVGCLHSPGGNGARVFIRPSKEILYMGRFWYLL